MSEIGEHLLHHLCALLGSYYTYAYHRYKRGFAYWCSPMLQCYQCHCHNHYLERDYGISMLADVAMLMFACVSANHLGLVGAVEDVLGVKLPIINCPKCSTFWTTLLYMVFSTHDVILSVATSFLVSYLALWLELGMGMTDILYNRLYDTIYTTEDEQASPTSAEKPDGGLSKLQQNRSTVSD